MPLSLDVGSALAFWLRHGTVHATCNVEDYGSLPPTTMSPQLRSIHAGVCTSQPFIVVRLRNHAGSSQRFRIAASADVRLKTRSSSSCSSNSANDSHLGLPARRTAGGRPRTLQPTTLGCAFVSLVSIRGVSPLGLPDTRPRSPRRRLTPVAWLARTARSRGSPLAVHEMASSGLY